MRFQYSAAVTPLIERSSSRSAGAACSVPTQCPIMRGMRPERTDGTLAAHLTEALEPRPEILEAYLFGSRARGDAHSRSDVDVAVYVDDARAATGPFGYQADLTTHLMTALGTDVIDVVVLNRAPALLITAWSPRAARRRPAAVPRNLRATTARAGYALSRYFDYLPQMEKMAAARRHAANEDQR